MGLDQRDPCGVIFCINYYALRAHDYTFVQVQLLADWNIKAMLECG